MKERKTKFNGKDIIVIGDHLFIALDKEDIKFIIHKNYYTHTLEELKSFVGGHLLNQNDDKQVIDYYKLETIRLRKLKIKNILENE